MSDEHLIDLEGRILAQEILMRAVLTGALSSNHDPLAALEEMRSDFRESSQNAERAIGEHEDAVWEAAMKALDGELGCVAIRLKTTIADR